MLEKLDAAGWQKRHARHLLNRAGFGGSPAEVDALHRMGVEQAVVSLTYFDSGGWEMPKPDWAVYEDPRERFWEMREGDDEERRAQIKEYQRKQRSNLMDLTWRWLDWMTRTPQPLREKLALFLHGHFATSADKVHSAYLLWQQNELFRREGVGSFVALTKAVSRDPAMLIYLDGRSSSRRKPNENFSREVMELFTLGEGHYSERDVTEAARAFTGYRIDPDTGGFRFVPAGHDPGPKTVFGRTGTFDGDAIIDLIFEQPKAGQFLARKLWEFFVHESPEDNLVAVLGERFRCSGYDTTALLRTIFRSKEFYSEQAMGTMLKSPVQWMVQAGRELECGLPGAFVCQKTLSDLGQALFRPPNVKAGTADGRGSMPRRSSNATIWQQPTAVKAGGLPNARCRMLISRHSSAKRCLATRQPS